MTTSRYWLIKSEPGSYSIEDLQRDGETCWDGVRNYQARNFMRDGMQAGDLVLFYHSNAVPTAIVGIARVARTAYPDPTAWDPTHAHYDAASTPAAPVWLMVDIGYVATLPRAVTLAEIKADPILSGMVVAQKGSRLSVQPATEEQFRRVCELGGWSLEPTGTASIP